MANLFIGSLRAELAPDKHIVLIVLPPSPPISVSSPDLLGAADRAA
jgi:hypothetical protein